MKAINTQGFIGRVSAGNMNSMSFSITTPELREEAALALLHLKGKNVNLLIEPEEGTEEVINVETKIEGKKPSQRLRAVLYILWQQEGKPDTFESYYLLKMEKIIDWIKGKLD